MTTKHNFVFVIMITIVLFIAQQVVYGFVDGNNNGRDDVQEWKESQDYRIGSSDKEADKNNRHIQCDIFNGLWNNTAGGSCKYTQGNNTCIIPTNGNPKCVPAGE